MFGFIILTSKPLHVMRTQIPPAGTMQYCGITINPISYFIIVMAIGLLVDFLMHILLRYYESEGKTRHEKVKDTLVDMGSSILYVEIWSC